MALKSGMAPGAAVLLSDTADCRHSKHVELHMPDAHMVCCRSPLLDKAAASQAAPAHAATSCISRASPHSCQDPKVCSAGQHTIAGSTQSPQHVQKGRHICFCTCNPGACAADNLKIQKTFSDPSGCQTWSAAGVVEGAQCQQHKPQAVAATVGSPCAVACGALTCHP